MGSSSPLRLLLPQERKSRLLFCCSAGVSSCIGLTLLNLSWCNKVTDAGVRALSSLPALMSLDLTLCDKVTAAGVQALRSTTAAPSLHIMSYV